MTVKSLAARRNEQNAVISYLEKLLERARSGEIISFSCIATNQFGEQEYLRTRDESPHETAGKMFAMAVDRIK